tara:strand:+ start:393 stop:548 length:156 start_codon:yes stop_codon:yes gene_type:complete
MKLLQEEKGQTSIEILLLLGGVIVVVTVVMLGIKQTAIGEGGETIGETINS